MKKTTLSLNYDLTLTYNRSWYKKGKKLTSLGVFQCKSVLLFKGCFVCEEQFPALTTNDPFRGWCFHSHKLKDMVRKIGM